MVALPRMTQEEYAVFEQSWVASRKDVLDVQRELETAKVELYNSLRPTSDDLTQATERVAKAKLEIQGIERQLEQLVEKYKTMAKAAVVDLGIYPASLPPPISRGGPPPNKMEGY